MGFGKIICDMKAPGSVKEGWLVKCISYRKTEAKRKTFKRQLHGESILIFWRRGIENSVFTKYHS